MTALVGKAFRYDGTGPSADPGRPHHCVIVGVTAKNDILVVPISSTHQNCDRTCLITPIQWDILTKESYAAYYQAKMRGVKSFEAAVQAGTIKLVPVPSPVFDRIIKGIDKTEEAEDFFTEAWRKLNSK